MNEILEKYLTISQFAKIYNINKKTLIYYDEINLFKPCIVKENGYRLYSMHQSNLFEVILVLKQMGMPLKKIKEYIDKRSKDELYNILKEHKADIEKQIKNLNRVNSIIDNKIRYIEKYKNINEDKILIEYMPEEYFILSESIKGIDENTAIKHMFEHMEYSYINKFYIGYGIGAMIDISELYNANFTNYSYYYTKLDKKSKNKKFFVKEAGNYVVGYYKGHWKTFHIFYKNLLKYIKDNDLKICGYSYEETIFDESSEQNFETYLTKFMIKIQ